MSTQVQNVKYAAIGLLVMLVLGFSIPQALATSAAKPIPTNSKPYGQSYGDWSADWWQWALSVSPEFNPLLYQTGENCDEGQSGSVWYLAGTFGGTADRECSVPAGKAILFPIVNTIYALDETEDEETVKELVRDTVDGATNLHTTIDGVSITDFSKFRAESDIFILHLDEGNVAGAPAGDYKSFADGYWIMLPPLSKGEHTINFGGDIEDFGLSVDVTYEITVG